MWQIPWKYFPLSPSCYRQPHGLKGVAIADARWTHVPSVNQRLAIWENGWSSDASPSPQGLQHVSFNTFMLRERVLACNSRIKEKMSLVLNRRAVKIFCLFSWQVYVFITKRYCFVVTYLNFLTYIHSWLIINQGLYQSLIHLIPLHSNVSCVIILMLLH